jgi:quinoprotein dehydrogenase-associated probable ABC transporter substrate-binding protein
MCTGMMKRLRERRHSGDWGRFLPAIAFAAIVLAIGTARAADRVEAVDRSALRVCADPSSLPYSNDKGEGFENKIADLMAKDLKVPVRYTWYPNTVGFLRNTLQARRCDLVIGIVAGAEMVLNTNPYYRSSYAIATRRKTNLDIDTLSDPRLARLKIGLIASTPPATVIASRGLMGNVRSYDLYVDTRYDQPGKRMMDDLARGVIDLAILWGPIAGYYAKQHGEQLKIAPLIKEATGARMDFYITMGVRQNETNWKNRINRLIRTHRSQITAILRDYGVPLLDAQGKPLL